MRLKVMMLGLRGFPSVQGGVERHCEHLSRELVSLGCDVTVIVRSRHMRHVNGSEWNGIRFIKAWSPRSPYFEAIVHSLIGVAIASIKRPDVLHVHGIGPALIVPIARLVGLNVIVTHHGQDYKRQKWGRGARTILRLGEFLGMKFSHAQIGISSAIAADVRERFGSNCRFIPNGVNRPEAIESIDFLNLYGLVPHRYVLMVGRIVPEKRQLDLINAFMAAKLFGWKLVLVGGADHSSRYATEVNKASKDLADVVLTGFQTEGPLTELYSNAGVFVLPSSHEGLPIALLEALSYGVPAIASDIGPHREIGLNKTNYFPLGDIASLTASLRLFAHSNASEDAEAIQSILKKYNWEIAAKKTLECYRCRFAAIPEVR